MDARERTGAERAAQQAVVVTIVLAFAKVAIWATTGSLAVLSQALDSILDVVALTLVLVGIRLAGKPPDTSHHYGHGKAENLVAFIQTLFLGAIVVGVVIGALDRLVSGNHPVETPWYAFAVLGLSAAIDAVRARALARVARTERSDALYAGVLNIVTDVGTAVVALVSLLLVKAGVDAADSIGSLVVAGAVAYAGMSLGRRSVDVLMDRAPQAPVEAIEAAAARAAGVSETRRVRVRGTQDRLFADVTVAAGRTASLERAHDIAEAVEQEIARVAPGADVVVHVEPVSETQGLVERVQAAASRVDEVHEVHNVLIHAMDEQGRNKLHVTLHAKVRETMSLEQAHDLSDRIEEAVESELRRETRVDTHIEPMRRTTFGQDVTAIREDVVASVTKLALEEPDVLDCHEVLVTSAGAEIAITAHVRGRRDLPLSKIHEASERIEKAIHAEHDEVGPVTIHFEPG